MKPIKKTDKRGNIYYKIGAVDGFHDDGTQYRKFTNYYPEPGMSRADIERELRIRQNAWELEVRQMHDEERKKGVPRNKGKQNFYDYALAYIERSAKSGSIKSGTVINYRNYLDGRLKERFGSMPLSDITTAQIDTFLSSLREPGVRKDGYAYPSVNLAVVLGEKGLTRVSVARMTGLTSDTIENVVKASAKPQEGTHFAIATAQKVADALNLPVEDIFQIERNMAPLADKNILEYYNLLGAVFRYAKRKGHISINPIEAVDRPRHKRTKVSSLTGTELLAIRDALLLLPESQFRWKVFTTLLIVTASRRGETGGLQWRHIDFDSSVLLIEQQLTSHDGQLEIGPTKEDEYRPIKLAAEVLEMLIAYREWYRKERESYILEDGTDLWRVPTNKRMERRAIEFPPFERPAENDPVSSEDFLFVQKGGFPGHPDSINNWLSAFEKQYNLAPIHPHKFRHTVASDLFEKGVNIEDISELLGHANSNVTKTVYVETRKEAKIRKSEALMNPFGINFGGTPDKKP